MDKVKIKNPLISVLILSIKFYQIFISPLLSNNCRFYPTCSQYCLESLNRFGFFKGIFYSFMRIKDCHPFGKSGFDPVKENIKFKRVTSSHIKKLRQKNLYRDLPNSLADYKEDNYPNTKHYAILKNESVVSALTIIERTTNKKKSVQLRGMFTIQKELNKGYGSLLIDKVSFKLKKENINLIWCNSRINVIDFYKKNKFKEIGKKFSINLLGDHKKLIRKL